MSVPTAPRNVGEVDSFVTLLLAACEDESVHGHLERLLSLPDVRRQATIHAWVTDLLVAEAPQDFIQAVACLMDDRVAEKAYEVIFKCSRDRAGGA